MANDGNWSAYCGACRPKLVAANFGDTVQLCVNCAGILFAPFVCCPLCPARHFFDQGDPGGARWYEDHLRARHADKVAGPTPGSPPDGAEPPSS